MPLTDMRQLLLVACLLAGCTGAPQVDEPAPAPEPVPQANESRQLVLVDEEIMGNGAMVAFDVPEAVVASELRLVRDTGASIGIRVDGIGACDGVWDDGIVVWLQSGNGISRPCGALEPGTYTLVLEVDGFLAGRLSLTART